MKRKFGQFPALPKCRDGYIEYWLSQKRRPKPKEAQK